MSGTDHKHPTFGVCTCGHMDFTHPWTEGQRVDYRAECHADVLDLREWRDDEGRRINVMRRCECQVFHNDGRGK